MAHVRLLNKAGEARPDIACGTDLCFGIDINDKCRYKDVCFIYDAAGCPSSDYCSQDWVWW